MMPKQNHSDSGIGHAIRLGQHFWDACADQIEERYGNNEDLDMTWEDPPGDLVVRRPSPIKSLSQPPAKDSSLTELEIMVRQIRQKGPYCIKLTEIMLSGLKEDLLPELYERFVDGTLPHNFLPIIKMNDSNKPYVEFLIKSNTSDEDPTSQLANHNAEHMAYSNCILEHLRNEAKVLKKRELQPKQIIKLPPLNPHREREIQPKRHETQPKRLAVNSAPKASSSVRSGSGSTKSGPGSVDEIITTPQVMTCSTPLSKQKKTQSTKRSVSLLKPQVDLNNSKRHLPHRSCKSKSLSG